MYEIMFFQNSIHDAKKLPGKYKTREEATHEIKARCKRFGAEIISLDYDDKEDGVDAMVKFGHSVIQYAVNRVKEKK